METGPHESARAMLLAQAKQYLGVISQ